MKGTRYRWLLAALSWSTMFTVIGALVSALALSSAHAETPSATSTSDDATAR